MANIAAADKIVKERLKKTQNSQKRYYDRQLPRSKFTIGQRVFAFMPVEKTGKRRKLNRPNYGPFFIRKLTDNNAEIELATNPEYRIFVALERLRPCPQEIPYDKTYTGKERRKRGRGVNPPVASPPSRDDETAGDPSAQPKKRGRPPGKKNKEIVDQIAEKPDATADEDATQGWDGGLQADRTVHSNSASREGMQIAQPPRKRGRPRRVDQPIVTDTDRNKSGGENAAQREREDEQAENRRRLGLRTNRQIRQLAPGFQRW